MCVSVSYGPLDSQLLLHVHHEILVTGATTVVKLYKQLFNVSYTHILCTSRFISYRLLLPSLRTIILINTINTTYTNNAINAINTINTINAISVINSINAIYTIDAIDTNNTINGINTII